MNTGTVHIHTSSYYCYIFNTSFLASTHARPSTAIKDTIAFDQYPSSGSIERTSAGGAGVEAKKDV